MNTFYTILFLLISQVGFSQTKTSISDGDWTNPSVWSPMGVPVGNEDSIIINHEIDVITVLAVSVNHLIIETNGILYADETFALGGNLKVEGEIVADTLVIGGGDYFINNGIVEADQFVTTNLMNENTGEMDLLGVFSIVEPFLNTSSGVIEALDLLTTSDGDMENNGVVYMDSWTNEGTVLGTGSFCIEECFQNVGTINGSLDICDVTPNSGIPCDLNIGTVAATVTFCAVGPCSGATGLHTSTVVFDVSVFPNPSMDSKLSISSEISIESIQIFDLMGRKVIEKVDGELNQIDISSLKNGDYLIVISSANHSVTKRITKIN